MRQLVVESVCLVEWKGDLGDLLLSWRRERGEGRERRGKREKKKTQRPKTQGTKRNFGTRTDRPRSAREGLSLSVLHTLRALDKQHVIIVRFIIIKKNLERLAELHLPLERPLRAPDRSVDNACHRKDTSHNSTHSCQERRERLALLPLNHHHGRDIKVKEHAYENVAKKSVQYPSLWDANRTIIRTHCTSIKKAVYLAIHWAVRPCPWRSSLAGCGRTG